MPWKNVKVRSDLYELIARRAAEDTRSVAQMTDRLLMGALEQGPGLPSDAPSPEGRNDRAGIATPVPARAPVAQRQIEGQTTVEEMLASCPNCAGAFVEHETDDGADTLTLCEDCGFVRVSDAS